VRKGGGDGKGREGKEKQSYAQGLGLESLAPAAHAFLRTFSSIDGLVALKSGGTVPLVPPKLRLSAPCVLRCVVC